jgi:hypothetical protein
MKQPLYVLMLLTFELPSNSGAPSWFPNCVSIVSLEHLLRYCATPPFALERLSVNRGADDRIARVQPDTTSPTVQRLPKCR